ncbi:MAG: CoA transferase [Dehalococcoidia bacterium]|nr:CoA transferase [Dehalococcoidia bacterium]
MTAFSGIRVLDFTTGISGPMATMFLADFGADVVKVEPPSGDPLCGDPGYLCWNRNKQRLVLDVHTYDGLHAARELIAGADVAVFDQHPGELERLGLDGATLLDANPRLLHAWLPAYGHAGRWSQLPVHDALLSAVTGAAFMQFSWDGVPVHLVTPQVSYGHALAAADALAAGLYERARSGLGQALEVNGLHGFSVIQSGSALRAGEVMRMRARGARGGVPNYRLYECADGQWLFLGTLMQAHFLKALEIMDLLDVFTMEGIDGEFTNILLPENSPKVIERLDARFAEKPRQEWLDILHEAGVPRGPVSTRTEWFDSETTAANEMRLTFDHPELGRVDIPGVPIKLKDTPGAVHALMQDTDLETVRARFPAGDSPGADAEPEEASAGPLAGVRILDLGMVIAGTHAATVLANYGADVIKVEPLDGDSFRPYGLGFVGFNQGKRSVTVDLKNPQGRELFYDLVRESDVVCDNYRLGVLERLGIDYDSLAAVNPRIISCSVTGYGSTGTLSTDPGFDPLMQARSGLMANQGGDDEPVFHQIPVNDTASAMVAAYGILAALHARERTGRGQRVESSLANQSIICQSGEMVTYEGRPPAPVGGQDCPGEAALRRLYACSDGWLMLWCTEPAQYQSLAVALGHPEWAGRMTGEQALLEPREGETAERLAGAFAELPLADAIDRLHTRGLPAAPAPAAEEIFESAWHRANGVFHETDHPQFGPMTTVRSFAEWSRTPGGFPHRAPLLGEHTREVLAEIGIAGDRVESLLQEGAVRQLDA